MSESADFWRTAMRKGMGNTAFLHALGGTLEDFADGKGRIRLPFQPFLVGNPDTGVIAPVPVTGASSSWSGLLFAP